jgi:hypothetical protein
MKMTNSVRIEPATMDDLVRTADGHPSAVTLRAGTYVIADPEMILEDSDWTIWHEMAEIESPATRGPGGMIFSARVNGHPVSGLTAYLDSGEYTDEQGRYVSTSSGILAAVPVALMDELGLDYSEDPVIEVPEDDMVFYSENNHLIFFGRAAEFYTGYPEDDER